LKLARAVNDLYWERLGVLAGDVLA
jgi:hypothetical protein